MTSSHSCKIAICTVDDSIKQLRNMLAEHFEVIMKHCKTDEELGEFAKDADGVFSDLSPITRRSIERFQKCKAIVLYSAGYDYVDVSAAEEHGISVSNMPDYCMEEVADHAITLALMLMRKIPQGDKDIKNNVWDYPRLLPIKALRDSVFGIVGLGRIGSVAALRAKAFGMRVLEYDPYLQPGREKVFGAESVDLQTLLKESDIVSLHVPLTKETFHMIGERELHSMKKTAYLINTCRGKVVDTKVLYEALRDGWIAGAALDVLEKEPPNPLEPLLHLPNVILTPHVGFYSERSIREKQRMVVEEFTRIFLEGSKPRYRVQPSPIELF
jgi:D-3-phosphoglycerate dehydrogenase